MAKPVIEVLGYKVTIKSIHGGRADGIWHKQDHLAIQLSFEPHVGNVVTASIELPVENYGKDEFIKAVKKDEFIKAVRDKLENWIPEMEAEYHKCQEKRRFEAKRREDLDSLAAQIERMIQQ